MSELHRSTPPRRPVTRRTVLRGMAGLGAVAATGGLVAACGGSAASAAPSIGPAPTPAGTMPPDETAVPSAEPTPVPQLEDELYVYNWADYIAEDTIAKFEDQYGVKVTYDFFDSAETQTAKIATGNSGYDVTFPTSSYLKGYHRAQPDPPPGPGADPERGEPGPRVAGSRLRPRQRPLDAVHVVDDRHCL